MTAVRITCVSKESTFAVGFLSFLDLAVLVELVVGLALSSFLILSMHFLDKPNVNAARSSGFENPATGLFLLASD